MKIQELVIQSSQIDVLRPFYKALMAGGIVEGDGVGFTIQTGISKIHFDPTEKPIPPVHIAFTLPENKWADALTLLKHLEIPLLEQEGQTIFSFPDWNAKSIYFRDTDGNILEFIVRFNLGYTSNEHGFNLSQVLSISEVGIVVDNPSEFISFLFEKGAFPLWKKYGEDFTAIGDEIGLLIIVKTERHWFPTTDSAKMVPIRIKIEGLQKPFQWSNYNFY